MDPEPGGPVEFPPAYVAYVQIHWKFQSGAQFFPTVNQGEPALVFCLVFFLFATRGPGRWAADGIAAALG